MKNNLVVIENKVCFEYLVKMKLLTFHVCTLLGHPINTFLIRNSSCLIRCASIKHSIFSTHKHLYGKKLFAD